MNKDSMQEYIFAAQRGDRQALVELLTYSWGIVSYQCKKLLPSRQSAEKMTTVVLKTVAEKLPSLTDPAKFYGWVGHLTAVRCMRVRATLLENGQGDAPETERNFSYIPIYTEKESECDGFRRVVRIEPAMYAYENNYVDKVTADSYTAMQKAMKRIVVRITGVDPDKKEEGTS